MDTLGFFIIMILTLDVLNYDIAAINTNTLPTITNNIILNLTVRNQLKLSPSNQENGIQVREMLPERTTEEIKVINEIKLVSDRPKRRVSLPQISVSNKNLYRTNPLLNEISSKISSNIKPLHSFQNKSPSDSLSTAEDNIPIHQTVTDILSSSITNNSSTLSNASMTQASEYSTSTDTTQSIVYAETLLKTSYISETLLLDIPNSSSSVSSLLESTIKNSLNIPRISEYILPSIYNSTTLSPDFPSFLTSSISIKKSDPSFSTIENNPNVPVISDQLLPPIYNISTPYTFDLSSVLTSTSPISLTMDPLTSITTKSPKITSVSDLPLFTTPTVYNTQSETIISNNNIELIPNISMANYTPSTTSVGFTGTTSEISTIINSELPMEIQTPKPLQNTPNMYSITSNHPERLNESLNSNSITSGSSYSSNKSVTMVTTDAISTYNTISVQDSSSSKPIFQTSTTNLSFYSSVSPSSTVTLLNSTASEFFTIHNNQSSNIILSSTPSNSLESTLSEITTQSVVMSTHSSSIKNTSTILDSTTLSSTQLINEYLNLSNLTSTSSTFSFPTSNTSDSSSMTISISSEPSEVLTSVSYEMITTQMTCSLADNLSHSTENAQSIETTTPLIPTQESSLITLSEATESTLTNIHTTLSPTLNYMQNNPNIQNIQGSTDSKATSQLSEISKPSILSSTEITTESFTSSNIQTSPLFSLLSSVVSTSSTTSFIPLTSQHTLSRSSILPSIESFPESSTSKMSISSETTSKPLSIPLTTSSSTTSIQFPEYSSTSPYSETSSPLSSTLLTTDSIQSLPEYSSTSPFSLSSETSSSLPLTTSLFTTSTQSFPVYTNSPSSVSSSTFSIIPLSSSTLSNIQSFLGESPTSKSTSSSGTLSISSNNPLSSELSSTLSSIQPFPGISSTLQYSTLFSTLSTPPLSSTTSLILEPSSSTISTLSNTSISTSSITSSAASSLSTILNTTSITISCYSCNQYQITINGISFGKPQYCPDLGKCNATSPSPCSIDNHCNIQQPDATFECDHIGAFASFTSCTEYNYCFQNFNKMVQSVFICPGKSKFDSVSRKCSLDKNIVCGNVTYIK